MLLALILPTLCLLWVLTPWAVREGDKASKGFLWATYPRESRNGNNPASQKVHEGGGLRFQWLIAYWPATFLAGVAALLATEGLVIGEQALWVVFTQIAAVTPTWALSRRWIDIGEHEAEVLHAEGAGIAGYREAETARMTRPGEEYHGKPFGEMMAKARFRAWAIGKLGAW